jgi:hypothetical protein
VPSVSSTASRENAWSFRPLWLFSMAGEDQVLPPSDERANQIRVLQLEDVLVPGPLPVVQPDSPERSAHMA